LRACVGKSWPWHTNHQIPRASEESAKVCTRGVARAPVGHHNVDKTALLAPMLGLLVVGANDGRRR